MSMLLNLAFGLFLLMLAGGAIFRMFTYRNPAARTCWRCGRVDKIGRCERDNCP